MSSKICLLVLLGVASLAQGYYVDQESKKDAEIIRNYFMTQDPRSIQRQFDEIFIRLTDIVQKGKLTAAYRANPGQVESIIREWIEIEALQIITLKEAKKTVDSIRREAIVKAPREWNQAIDKTIQQFAVLRHSAASGNIQDTRWAMIQIMSSFNEVNNNLRKVISSRRY